MNRTWHLIKKDLRRNRLLLGLCVALPALQAGLTALAMDYWIRPLYVLLPKIIPPLDFFSAALLMLVAAQLVLEDPLKDTTAFWPTRPISGRRLLVAKASLFGLLIVLPVLPWLALDRHLGANLGELGLGAAERILWNGVLVFGTAALAALVEKSFSFLVRAILIAFGTACAVFVVMTFVPLLTQSFLSEPPFLPPGPATTQILSAVLVAKFTAVGFGAGLLVWLYAVRHPRGAGLIAYLVALLVLVTPMLWPWDYLAPHRFPEASFARTQYPRFSLADSVLQITSWGAASGRINSLMLPNGDVAVPLKVRNVSIPDLNETLGYSGDLVNSVSATTCAPDALERALAPLHLLNPPRQRGIGLILFFLNPAESVQPGIKDGMHLQADVDGALMRYKIEAEVPLKAAESARLGHAVFDLEWIRPRDGKFRVALREQEFDSAFLGYDNSLHTDVLTDTALPPPSGPNEGVVYLLVNRSRGEALLPRTARIGVAPAPLDKLLVDYPILEFDPGVTGQPLDPEWLRGASLLRVRLVEVGPLIGTLMNSDISFKN